MWRPARQSCFLSLTVAAALAWGVAAPAADGSCRIDATFKNEGQSLSNGQVSRSDAKFLGDVYTIPSAPSATTIHLVLDPSSNRHEVSALAADGAVLASREFQISERCEGGWITHEIEQSYSGDGNPGILKTATKLRVDGRYLQVIKSAESQLVILGIPQRKRTSQREYRFALK